MKRLIFGFKKRESVHKENELVKGVLKSLMRYKAKTKGAAEIMGANYFDLNCAMFHFGFIPKVEQIELLSEIPFSKKILKENKDTHILVAVTPLSILSLVSKMPLDNTSLSWLRKESFANTPPEEVSWQLVRIAPIANSSKKPLKKQAKMLKDGEKIPSVHTMIYTIVGHYLAHHEILFRKQLVRTSSRSSNNNTVAVGNLNKDRLIIVDYKDGHSSKYLYVSGHIVPLPTR